MSNMEVGPSQKQQISANSIKHESRCREGNYAKDSCD